MFQNNVCWPEYCAHVNYTEIYCEAESSYHPHNRVNVIPVAGRWCQTVYQPSTCTELQGDCDKRLYYVSMGIPYDQFQ